MCNMSRKRQQWLIEHVRAQVVMWDLIINGIFTIYSILVWLFGFFTWTYDFLLSRHCTYQWVRYGLHFVLGGLFFLFGNYPSQKSNKSWQTEQLNIIGHTVFCSYQQLVSNMSCYFNSLKISPTSLFAYTITIVNQSSGPGGLKILYE